MKKIFLDDFRNPAEVFHYMPDQIYLSDDWVIVRSYEEFVDKVQELHHTNQSISLVSFDHDLSDVHYSHTSGEFPYDSIEEKTGYHCAKWMCDFYADYSMQFPEYKVHSMNPVGSKNISSYIENFKKHVTIHTLREKILKRIDVILSTTDPEIWENFSSGIEKKSAFEIDFHSLNDHELIFLFERAVLRMNSAVKK